MKFTSLVASDTQQKGFLRNTYAILSRAGCLASFLYRLSHALHHKGKIGWALSMLCVRLNIILNSCEIQPVATIGPGFSIVHTVGIVIGNASIGSNVSVYQNVTIGRGKQENTSGGKEVQPVIGDGVVIYAGAAVLGAIKIGNNARIGANAVIMRDVPNDAVFMAPPARSVPQHGNQIETE